MFVLPAINSLLDFVLRKTLHTCITRPLSFPPDLRFSGDQECYYEDDLRILSSLTKKEHMRGNETLLDFRTSKFVLRISRDSYQLLKRHLQERQNNQIWNIIQEHLYIDIFDGMPRSKSQIDAMSGSLAGEAKREANKAKVGFMISTLTQTIYDGILLKQMCSIQINNTLLCYYHLFRFTMDC